MSNFAGSPLSILAALLGRHALGIGVWASFFGAILPAAGGSISNIPAYDQTKKAPKTPDKFGTGIPDGVIAPMILGVVLGHIAELNLNRALSTSDDLLLFLTRPWSLFFLILGAFSCFFPLYQRLRGTARWTLVYPAAMSICLSAPLFMMGGGVRPALGGFLIVFGGYMIRRHARRGWRLDAVADREARPEET